jgi:transposase
VVEGAREEPETGALVVTVRLGWRDRDRCGLCRRHCPGFDRGEGPRRWWALDLGSTVTWLEAESPRVSCPEHGVVVTAVPWARHGARFTTEFEDQVACLVARSAQSTVAVLLRISWRSVAAIVTRVGGSQERGRDLFANLQRIGIDEISYRKGQRYLTVVFDHDTGHLVWAEPGRDRATLAKFVDALGDERCRRIRRVSRDGASWIVSVVDERCPNAIQCTDPFHVVRWATDALDEVHRQVWMPPAREASRAWLTLSRVPAGHSLHNPENLTERQQATLVEIERTNQPLFRAYLLKEELRYVFQLSARRGLPRLDRWIQWARRSRLAPFVKLARTITEYRASIAAALRYGLSNAPIESGNQKIRLIIRGSFGFHYPAALIALAKLSLGGLCPALPGRV